MKEKHARSITKAITWRVFASCITMLIVFVFTGKAALSLGIGLFEIVSKLILYYTHERMWDRVRWGKKAN
jgi:adenylylsulfate kinase